jgi:hypothetical protein
MKRVLATILFIVLLLPGCSAVGNAKDFMKDMGAVQAAVIKLTEHKDTRVVHLNGHILQIVLMNSKYNDLDDEQKEQASKEIAKTAYSTLQKARGIDEVLVIFHVHNIKMGVVDVNDSRDSYTYPIAELTGAEPEVSASPAP